ncbi:MAG: HlyD family secretion protein [Devosia sp.]
MNARATEPTIAEKASDAKLRPVSAAAPAPAAAAPEPVANAAAPRKNGTRRVVLMAGVPLLLLAAGGWFWLTGGRYEETDNAYVQQSKVSLSADVSGRVADVLVQDNQMVAAGDTLFSIDPQPFQIALSQANAALASARVNVEQLKVSFGTAQAQLQSSQERLEIEQTAFDRKAALVTQGVTADSSLDDSKLTLQQAQTAVDLARQQVAAATAALAGNPEIVTDEHPAVLAALAAVEQAQRNLSKTTVTAPAAGIVSNVSSLNVGQFISAGSMIASLVETDNTWIQANFKETQLANLKVGQPVEIKVDAFGEAMHGTLESFGAATGSEFALIPAQNATGNWVKVVQRLPVRIALSDGSNAMLKTGMSAMVTVDTGRSTLDKLQGK